jgi:hypothetical protein
MGNDEAAVWSIYTGVRKSVLSINFQWMRDRGASPERLAGLASDLSALPGWGHLVVELEASLYGKRPPSVPPPSRPLPPRTSSHAPSTRS